jgi:hypothetical protein
MNPSKANKLKGISKMATQKEIFEYAYKAGSLGVYKANPFNKQTQPKSFATFVAGIKAGTAEKVTLNDSVEICTARREAAFELFMKA